LEKGKGIPFFTIPVKCARCNSDNAEVKCLIGSGRDRLFSGEPHSPLGASLWDYVEYLRGKKLKSQVTTFSVLICHRCQAVVKKSRSLSTWCVRLVVLFQIFRYIDWLLSSKPVGITINIFFLILSMFFGLMIGGGIADIIGLLSNARVGSFNGRQFRFINFTYQHLFASQNPSLASSEDVLPRFSFSYYINSLIWIAFGIMVSSVLFSYG